MDEDTLKKAMDSYGNVRHQLELLKSNRQTAIDKILEKYPDAKKDFQEMQEELDSQIETAEKTEKQLKKVLETMIDVYAKDAPIKDKLTLKSGLLSVSLTKKVQYDSGALDGFALNNPLILGFRSEEISSRITLNKV